MRGRVPILSGALWLGLASAAAASQALVDAALERTAHSVRYDGSYVAIAYPGGDVPAGTGVCSDLVIRSFRAVGVDLQRLVHEDMRSAFHAYPRDWGLARPDPNIDHRRVPNLETFFRRHALVLEPVRDPSRFAAGDIVTWRLGGRLPHIGIVSSRFAPGSRRPMVIHNVGLGPMEEDVLFAYPLHAHFRYAR